MKTPLRESESTWKTQFSQPDHVNPYQGNWK